MAVPKVARKFLTPPGAEVIREDVRILVGDMSLTVDETGTLICLLIDAFKDLDDTCGDCLEHRDVVFVDNCGGVTCGKCLSEAFEGAEDGGGDEHA